MWLYVTQHFQGFQSNISLRPEEHEDALGKAHRVARCLHTYYQEEDEFNLDNFLLIGSYAKGTAIRPTSDVDLMYFLPHEVFKQYSQYQNNPQSALLQEVRTVLRQTFSTTEIKADGQAVIVDYQSRRFEVIPAFIFNGQIYIADTSNGGSWKPTSPIQEAERLNRADISAEGQIRNLIQYAKVWKRIHDVPLKAIILEYVALNFVNQWSYLEHLIQNNNPSFWHDWLVRDFFAFLLQYDCLNLDHDEVIPFGDGWQRKAQYALSEAKLACAYETQDQCFMAEIHWRNIFGSQFPTTQRSSFEKLLSLGLRETI